MADQRGKQVESDASYKRRVRLYAWAVPGMHRAGPGERGGASYGRRAVAAAKGASKLHANLRGGEGVNAFGTAPLRAMLPCMQSRTISQNASNACVHRFTRASTYHEWRESPALPCSAPVRPATISRPALTRLDQPLGRRAPATKLATPLVTNNLATRAQ